MITDLCSCDTQKPFSLCCQPVLLGVKIAETPADLMRARYTAFVKQEIDFILNTVSPSTRKSFDRKGIEDWSRDTDWAGLEIVATEKGGVDDEKGQVEFIARFREKGEVKKHHELATFVKVNGSWFFEDGRTPPIKQVISEGPKIGRNDPCHCGSGKKFKKCHGSSSIAGN
jgi:SEC-C motif-containing protein